MSLNMHEVTCHCPINNVTVQTYDLKCCSYLQYLSKDIAEPICDSFIPRDILYTE